MSTTLTSPADRESIADGPNPLGMEGIEFIEYATSKPQALGQVLEMMGFRPVARHRSREVMLYRQGDVNVIVNAHEAGMAHSVAPSEKPVIAAIALRVRDAAAAYKRALNRGAWAVHGVGSSRIYFVDRCKEFSIYDVDFTPIPGVDQHPPATTGLRLFGLVQYIGNDRAEDWTEFYHELFGFEALGTGEHFGILPKGRILRSPCHSFYLQLIEPEPGVLAVEEEERFHRVGLGTDDVLKAVNALRERGVEFVESKGVHVQDKGALTRTWLGTLSFELVHNAKA
jgi:4-hydroxyphenylpyruvate dioxygenase